MIEIPESKTVARQVRETLAGHTVTDVFNATHPHKFTWYSGDPLEYRKLLTGRRIVGAEGYGAFVDILLDDDVHLLLSDGVNLRLYASEAAIPAKYQLLVTLDDERFLVFTVAMYGGILAFRGDFENPYYRGAKTKYSPLDAEFDTGYFRSLLAGAKPNLSAKASWPRSNAFRDSGTGCCRTFFSGQASIPNANSPHWTKRMPNGFSER